MPTDTSSPGSLTNPIRSRKTLFRYAVIFAAIFFLAGCSTMTRPESAANGAVIGAVFGGLVGGGIGAGVGGSQGGGLGAILIIPVGVAIGATVGALIGGIIGYFNSEKQKSPPVDTHMP